MKTFKQLTESSPPGWSKTVEAMKEKGMSDNKAFALAWSMYKKGYKSHIPEETEIIQEDDYNYYNEFQDPGGRSALRKATKSNPRNKPCPTCKEPNRLTPRDVALHYQCDRCADTLERGVSFNEEKDIQEVSAEREATRFITSKVKAIKIKHSRFFSRTTEGRFKRKLLPGTTA